MHHSVGERVGVREYAIGFGGVVHVFLNAEIGNAEIEMQSGGHAHGAHIRSAVASGTDVIYVGEAGDFSEMRNSAGVPDSRADIVDQLFVNELLAIVDGVENLADGERCGGVSPYQAKTFLQLGGRGIFEPKQVIRLELFAEAAGFDRCKPVMRVVKKMQVGAKLL